MSMSKNTNRLLVLWVAKLHPCNIVRHYEILVESNEIGDKTNKDRNFLPVYARFDHNERKGEQKRER